MLVVDANVAVAAARVVDGFATLAATTLVAPPFMWSEARSALHEAVWRGELPAHDAHAARARVDSSPIEARAPARLGEEAWQIADAFGWAKTYDAEYLALAQILECRFVTLDARLRRATRRLGFVVSPTEL